MISRILGLYWVDRRLLRDTVGGNLLLHCGVLPPVGLGGTHAHAEGFYYTVRISVKSFFVSVYFQILSPMPTFTSGSLYVTHGGILPNFSLTARISCRGA